MLLAATLAAWARPVRSAPAPDDGYIEYSGTASALHGQNALYGEHHVLSYRAGRLSERVVLYTCPNGVPFARKKVTYVDPEAPDFLFDDASSGMQEGVRSQDGKRSVFFQASRTDTEKSAPLPKVAGLVVDAGFDEFIRAHWNALMKGDDVPLHFLVPSRLQAISFEVRHLRSDHVDGQPVEVFRLKLTGFLGFFLSSIDVSYETAQHVLVRFDGISDVRDAHGDNMQASIVFHSSDRRPTSAQAFVTAEQAKITACH
jgi:hypothetical protein